MNKYEKNEYIITLEGCDADTTFSAELTEHDYEVVKMISDKSMETSYYQCMPILNIKEVDRNERTNKANNRICV